MASPFTIFRRHQKVSLAVLGVVVMIGFVVLPAILQMQEFGGGGSDNPVVLTWNGGKLHEHEMASKRHVRSNLLRFIQQLQDDARKEDPDAQIPRDIGIPANDSPRSIAQSLVLAEKARQMGIVVSDQTVADYLANICGGVLTPDEMAEAKSKALGSKWTEEMLFNALREELLAVKLQQMVLNASSPMDILQNSVITPAAAWEYHGRTEREVTAEFVAFKVDDYLKDVTTEPTNKEVEELYEKHKNDYPVPNSAEPAFKEWAKAEFQYFVGDYDKLLQEEKLKVTREQIEKYYADNKNSFRVDEEPAVETVETNADDPRTAKPMPPVPPTEDAAPTDETAPAEEATLPPKNDETGGEPGDQGEAGAAGEAASETPAVDDKPAETKPAGEEPATEPEAKLPPVIEEPTDTPPTTESPASDDDLTAPPEKTPKYKPLADVEDEIRRQLAAQPAQKRLEAALADALKALREYRDAVVLHKTDPENLKDPGKFDYKRVAKKLGLVAGETKMISALDFYNDPKIELGQSYRLDPTSHRPIPFTSEAFSESKRPYYPLETQSREGNKVFLSWKIAEEEASVPKLKDIRDEVVAAWKRAEARKLAKAAAEKLAAEVVGDKPLGKQVESGTKVLNPPPFRYFDLMSFYMAQMQGTQPDFDVIQGIEDGSSDSIKRKVMSLPVGAVDVAEDRSKSTYYVVRVIGEGDRDALRKKFMQSIVDNPQDGPPQLLRSIGIDDQVALLRDWNNQIDEEFDVEWDKDYLERSAGRE